MALLGRRAARGYLGPKHTRGVDPAASEKPSVLFTRAETRKNGATVVEYTVFRWLDRMERPVDVFGHLLDRFEILQDEE